MKKYDYEDVFQRLLKVVKTVDKDRKLDCLFATEFVEVNINGVQKQRMVIQILKELGVDIPATSIVVKKNTMLLFSSKASPKYQNTKKKEKEIAKF